MNKLVDHVDRIVSTIENEAPEYANELIRMNIYVASGWMILSILLAIVFGLLAARLLYYSKKAFDNEEDHTPLLVVGALLATVGFCVSVGSAFDKSGKLIKNVYFPRVAIVEHAKGLLK